MERFQLGEVSVTSQAAAFFRKTGIAPESFLGRHVLGDHGDVSVEVAAKNAIEIHRAGVLVSRYPVADATGETVVFIFTHLLKHSTMLALAADLKPLAARH